MLGLLTWEMEDRMLSKSYASSSGGDDQGSKEPAVTKKGEMETDEHSNHRIWPPEFKKVPEGSFIEDPDVPYTELGCYRPTKTYCNQMKNNNLLRLGCSNQKEICSG